MPTPPLLPQPASLRGSIAARPLRTGRFAFSGRRLIPRLAEPLITAAFAAVVLGFLAAAPLRADDWKDVQGKTFSGSPVEAMGPFVLFSSKPAVGRWLPVQGLPLPELARFSAAVKDHPPCATEWAKAKGTVTAELLGHLRRIEKEKFVPASVDGLPEPAIVVVLFMSRGASDNWKLIWPSMDPLGVLAKQTPRTVECVVYGWNFTSWELMNTLKDAAFAPWLIIDPDEVEKLDTLRSFAPSNGYAMVVMSRDGVPLFGAANPDEDAVKGLWKNATEFAALLNPAQPLAWKPLAYYRTAQQMAAHPTGRVEPELQGPPLRPGALARHGVHAFDATLKVAADGTVSDVSVKSGTPIPPKVEDAIVRALKMAVLVPAIENGTPVAGEFAYHYSE